MREASEFLTKLETEIAHLKDQLEKLRTAKPIDQMTVPGRDHSVATSRLWT